MEMLGISLQTKNFKHHILPYIAQGLIQMTISETPTSKNQRYVISEKGKVMLQRSKSD